jgi:hypothetical protein
VALIRRTIAAALAGVALAATSVAPASAYWRASGQGAGTATADPAEPRLLTLTLTNGTGHTVKGSGTAGLTPKYLTAITVVLCRTDTTWPCPAGSTIATLTATAGTGSPSYTTNSSAQLANGTQVYGMASQMQASGWKDYSPVVSFKA